MNEEAEQVTRARPITKSLRVLVKEPGLEGCEEPLSVSAAGHPTCRADARGSAWEQGAVRA